MQLRRVHTLLLALFLLLPTNSLWARDNNWITNVEEGVKKAKIEGKDVLVIFTGSDWCGWSIALEKKILNQPGFQKNIRKNFVLVRLDYPRKKKVDKEMAAYREKMRRKFDLRHIPSVYLLDGTGRPYGRTTYRREGPASYREHLEEMVKNRRQVTAMISQAKNVKSPEKGLALDRVLTSLDKMGVGFGYLELKDTVVEWDRENKHQLREKYAAQLADYYHLQKNRERYKKYLDILKKADPRKAQKLIEDLAQKKVRGELAAIDEKFFQEGKWAKGKEVLQELANTYPKGPAGQLVQYHLAMVCHQMKDKPGVIRHLKKALACSPKSLLAPRIQKLINHRNTE